LLVNLSDDFQPLGWDRELHIGVDEESFERIPDVLAMKPLISQVFSNIIENAIKYSDNNTRVLIAGEYDEAQGMAIVRISNKGIGIGHGEGDRIFERGVRGDKAKVRYPAGTGFGLFIARKIIEIHRGSVWAYMAPDNLTVFEVKLTVRGLEGLTKQWPAKRS